MGLLVCAVGFGACASGGEPTQASPTEFYPAAAEVVLSAAEELLARQGYVFEQSEIDYGMLVGQQLRRVTARRPRDTFPRETVLRTQVVIEAAAQGPGTAVRATFSINERKATGERRTYSPETPQALQLRRRFYADLRDELDVRLTSGLTR